jgi:hypothetical protein
MFIFKNKMKVAICSSSSLVASLPSLSQPFSSLLSSSLLLAVLTQATEGKFALPLLLDPFAVCYTRN